MDDDVKSTPPENERPDGAPTSASSICEGGKDAPQSDREGGSAQCLKEAVEDASVEDDARVDEAEKDEKKDDDTPPDSFFKSFDSEISKHKEDTGDESVQQFSSALLDPTSDPTPCPLYMTEAAITAPAPSYPIGEAWDVVLIREGWSRNGRYYPRETLVEAAARGIFNCPIYAYGWRDDGRGLEHLPAPIRDRDHDESRNKVGWIEGSSIRDAADGRVEVVGRFHWVDAPQRARMAEAWRLGKRDFLGFSIDGTGTSAAGIAEGRRGPIITRITHISETTLVSDPAAGGRFERLVAATTQEDDNPMDSFREFLRARLTEGKCGDHIADMDDAALAESAIVHLKEMGVEGMVLSILSDLLGSGQVDAAQKLLGNILDAIGKEEESMEKQEQPNPGLEESMQKLHEQEQRITEAEQRIAVRECAMILRDRLAESKLAKPAQEFVRKQFDGKVFEESALLEAIDAQIKYIAEIMGGGEVQVPNAGRVLREGRDKLIAGMDLAFGYKPAADEKLYEGLVGKRHSIKSIYEELTGDHEVTGEITSKGILQEATTSSITNLLGTSMEKALVQNYREMPDEWRKVATINPNVDNFKLQSRVRWDGFADLDTISESTSTAYTDLGFPSDAVKTYTVATYGGLVTVTRRMIKNDDLGSLQEIPRRLGRAAKNKLNRYVFNGIAGALGGTLNGDTTYDSVALYAAGHFNYATTALSHASFVSARAMLENQREYGIKTTVKSSGTTLNNTTDPVSFDTASGGTTGMVAGMYIVCESEIMKITAVVDGDTLTVARGLCGTAAAAHADSTAIYVLGSPLPVNKIYAVAPFELRGTMEAVLGSEKVPGGANNDFNFLNREMQSGRIEPLFVSSLWLGGDVNNWYLVSDPGSIPSFELAFLDNRQEPELFVSDNPTVDNVFSYDAIRYKIRHEYAGAMIDWRGVQGNIVA